MGVKKLKRRVILLDNKKFDYTEGQIRRFVSMWEKGDPISSIAAFFKVTQLEVYLLILHAADQELIEPRPGGLLGNDT